MNPIDALKNIKRHVELLAGDKMSVYSTVYKIANDALKSHVSTLQKLADEIDKIETPGHDWDAVFKDGIRAALCVVQRAIEEEK